MEFYCPNQTQGEGNLKISIFAGRLLEMVPVTRLVDCWKFLTHPVLGYVQKFPYESLSSYFCVDASGQVVADERK